jgi:hypothetical protein
MITITKIKQIIPAPPGWTFKYVWVGIDDGAVHVESIPILGQALVEREWSGGGDDAVEFYGFYEGGFSTATELRNTLRESEDSFILGIFPPGGKPHPATITLAQEKIAQKTAKAA